MEIPTASGEFIHVWRDRNRVRLQLLDEAARCYLTAYLTFEQAEMLAASVITATKSVEPTESVC